MFSKIRTVKEEVERAKYSELIICPLINYICFRIKVDLRGNSKCIVNKDIKLELSILSKIKLVKCFFK